MIVVIDDEREFVGNSASPERMKAVHFKDSDSAMTKFFSFRWPVSELWLDHDLGGPKTTRSLAYWLAEEAWAGRPYPVKKIYVHTANPVASDWIVGTLEKYYDVEKADPEFVGLVPNTGEQ